MGGSVLIILIGMLVPVLAAAPFYILDHRAQRRAREEAEQALAAMGEPESEDDAEAEDDDAAGAGDAAGAEDVLPDDTAADVADAGGIGAEVVVFERDLGVPSGADRTA
ncbi:hypothetical protein HUO13_06455 [Saccharopolyspora erythraea]|uniref:hypothetical protein n=1 Tax=Saccharopolyspora erythraea TaxID=1836 RepID=UPI001BAB7CEB|nr:hypothetical protein [Saccharopolyspora erythraea]QUH00506.1 hypothetical protein HUO13_06455 [Saccharopolyspora erythraea]